MSASANQLIILSGPSCAGKTPLKEALEREFPQLLDGLESPVLYHSRAPRPGEEDGVDYHFRSKAEIEALREDRDYLVIEVRDELQAVDLREVADMLRAGDVFFEGNWRVGLALKEREELEFAEVLDVFLSPLSSVEVQALQEESLDIEPLVTELMRRRLLRRAAVTRPILSLLDLQDVEARAGAAYEALVHADRFTHVIPNHDGEDSDHWEALPCTLGDARRAVRTMAALMRGETPPWVESWSDELFARGSAEQ